MSFPLVLAGRSFATPPDLAAAVAADVRAGGGQLGPEPRATDWLIGRVGDGSLDAGLAVGLCAALLQSREVALLCEGARLATALGRAELGPVVGLALQAQDAGVLLAADVGAASDGGLASVEETLLAAWASLADRADPTVRAHLLAAARNAGAGALELELLLGHGSPTELRADLPGALREGLSPEAQQRVEAARARGPEVADAIDAALATYAADQRAVLR